jgi:hypothetical protein
MKDNKMMKENDKSKIIKSYVGVLIFAVLFIGIVTLFPERKDIILSESTKYFIEMLLIIPPVMLSGQRIRDKRCVDRNHYWVSTYRPTLHVLPYRIISFKKRG